MRYDRRTDAKCPNEKRRLNERDTPRRFRRAMVAGVDASGTVVVVGRSVYTVTEETLHTPVTPLEADALLREDGKPLKARHALPHFLYRVRVTLSTLESQVEGNRQTIAQLREKRARMGAPTTLSPLDAVRYASPEELSKIVGQINSSQLVALETAVNGARSLRDELLAELTTTRAAVRTLLDKESLPTEVRLELIRLINGLPDDPSPVVEPPDLEMARAVGLLPTPAADAAQPAPLLELPDGDPLADLPEVAESGHVALSEHRAWGAAPQWVPGPGPRVGS